jgi:hypothetical protein
MVTLAARASSKTRKPPPARKMRGDEGNATKVFIRRFSDNRSFFGGACRLEAHLTMEIQRIAKAHVSLDKADGCNDYSK